MAYEKDGRFWPTDVDRSPRTDRFHVPSSSLRAEDHDPLKRAIVITEADQDVQNRLAEEFPLYRLAKWGKEIIKRGAE